MVIRLEEPTYLLVVTFGENNLPVATMAGVINQSYLDSMELSGNKFAVFDHVRNGVEIPHMEYMLGYYWNEEAGEAQERPTFPITIDKQEVKADDTDEIVITGLDGVDEFSIDDVTYQLKGKSLRLTFPAPSVYVIKIDKFPYKVWTAKVTAK